MGRSAGRMILPAGPSRFLAVVDGWAAGDSRVAQGLGVGDIGGVDDRW